MSRLLAEKDLHDYLERISERGCEAVNELIRQADEGQAIPEVAHLDKIQQDQVLVELKKVMAVYTSCELSKE